MHADQKRQNVQHLKKKNNKLSVETRLKGFLSIVFFCSDFRCNLVDSGKGGKV